MPDLDRWRATADEAARRDQQLRRAMEIARIGTWEWEVQGNRVYWSEELYRMYGLSFDAFEGTVEAFLARVHPDDRDASLGAVLQALETGEPFDFRERILRPDGEMRVLHSQGEVVRDGEGRAVRLFGVCQDITVQIDVERRAQRLATVVETERVLQAMAALLPLVEAARSLADELAGGAAGHEPDRRRELVRCLDRAHDTLLALTAGPGPAAIIGTVE